MLRTCVSPDGQFMVGTHKPHFHVANLRETNGLMVLGSLSDGTGVRNHGNFPEGAVEEPEADIVYEICNPFPFKGTTYINSAWADRAAQDPGGICLPVPEKLSLTGLLDSWMEQKGLPGPAGEDFISMLPRPLLLALASSSTDPRDLVRLAEMSCRFVYRDGDAIPSGLGFRNRGGNRVEPDIRDHALFDSVANNRFLPDAYKEVMVLRPGAQGTSEIVGEWKAAAGKSHVYEYLRRNSYIPWGHYAANTANDTVRYRAVDLLPEDMKGMRHLCYQRVYLSVARQLGIELPGERQCISGDDLEQLRMKVIEGIRDGIRGNLAFNASLWGWNFGYGYAQSGYRLHASHQQIHQQYAMIPRTVDDGQGGNIPSYACGDLIAGFVREYRQETGNGFFDDYLNAIRSNRRVDGRTDRDTSLVVMEDENVMLFVPKAQTSQWELQMMPLRPCGNILEADTSMRDSIDMAILAAIQTLESMGASMVTSIEYSKRFDTDDRDQQLLFAFLPKLPESPGAFSEAQLRWITGHYPEDFATACRSALMNHHSAVQG